MSNLVSAAHSLKIVDIEDISIFNRSRSQVILSWRNHASPLASIPGTIRPSSTPSDKGYTKTITFSVAIYNHDLADLILFYSKKRLLAIYTDARGRVRVCGSPEYPLRLSYTIQNGIISVTMTGIDTHDDGYLLLA